MRRWMPAWYDAGIKCPVVATKSNFPVFGTRCRGDAHGWLLERRMLPCWSINSISVNSIFLHKELKIPIIFNVCKNTFYSFIAHMHTKHLTWYFDLRNYNYSQQKMFHMKLKDFERGIFYYFFRKWTHKNHIKNNIVFKKNYFLYFIFLYFYFVLIFFNTQRDWKNYLIKSY